MTRRRSVVAFVALLALPFGSAGAQPVRPAQRPFARRAQMQDRLADVVQRRLGLSGEQMARLRRTTNAFARERQEMVTQERELRRLLRAALASADSSNQGEIGRQLDALVRLQQRRASSLADEQRALAGFLTPRQRAEFFGLQERALRAAQQIRQRRAAEPQP